MKIDRKEANPVEVFIPFVVQITIENEHDARVFEMLLDVAGENGSEPVVDLSDDLRHML